MCPFCKRKLHISKSYQIQEEGKTLLVREYVCKHKDCPSGNRIVKIAKSEVNPD